jgi:hypothetical protein
MGGQDFSPHGQGSSGCGAALDPGSPKMRRFAGPENLVAAPYFLLCFFLLPFLTRVTVSGWVFGTPATPVGTKWMKTLTVTRPFPFFRTRFLSFLAVLPVAFTISSKVSARGRSITTGRTAAALAPASGGASVWSRVTWPGLGTLAMIDAVPFFLMLVTELTVILLDGAAASCDAGELVGGPVTPADPISAGFSPAPLMFARPTAFVS